MGDLWHCFSHIILGMVPSSRQECDVKIPFGPIVCDHFSGRNSELFFVNQYPLFSVKPTFS